MPKKYRFDVSEPEEVDNFEIETPTNIYVVSKTKSGKSVLLKHLMLCLINADSIDEIYIQGMTMEYNHDYDELKPLMQSKHKFISCNNFNIVQLQAVYDRQRKKKLANLPMRRVVFLLDDIIGSFRQGDNESLFISNLSTHARHLNITLIMSVQYVKGILSPMIRENATNLLFSSITKDAETQVASMCHVNKEAIEFITSKLKKFEFCYYSNDGSAQEATFKIVKVSSLDDGKEIEPEEKIEITPANMTKSNSKVYKRDIIESEISEMENLI